MRKVICYENALAVGDHFLLEGSVQWDEEKEFPVVWQFNHELHSLLGYAKDLQREEDGAITADLNLADLSYFDMFEEGLIAATFEGNELQGDMHDDVRVISNVRVRVISLVAIPQVPWRS